MTTEEAIKIIRRKTSIPENREIFEIIEMDFNRWMWISHPSS